MANYSPRSEKSEFSAVGFSGGTSVDSTGAVGGASQPTQSPRRNSMATLDSNISAAHIPGLTAHEVQRLRKKYKCTELELKEFKEIFNLVDKDSGGTISADELSELMDTLGIKATEEDVEAMIEEIDADKNGEIDFEEFVAVMSRKIQADYTAEDVKEAFKVFEGGSADGMISVDNLITALTTYGKQKLSFEEAKELVAQLEPDGNGLINYADYVDMMMAHSSFDENAKNRKT